MWINHRVQWKEIRSRGLECIFYSALKKARVLSSKKSQTSKKKAKTTGSNNKKSYVLEECSSTKQMLLERRRKLSVSCTAMGERTSQEFPFQQARFCLVIRKHPFMAIPASSGPGHPSSAAGVSQLSHSATQQLQRIAAKSGNTPTGVTILQLVSQAIHKCSTTYSGLCRRGWSYLVGLSSSFLGWAILLLLLC